MPDILPDETIDMIREMRARNVPVQLVAQMTGVSPGSVNRYTTGCYKLSATDEFSWMPAWPLTGWQIRACEIKGVCHGTKISAG